MGGDDLTRTNEAPTRLTTGASSGEQPHGQLNRVPTALRSHIVASAEDHRFPNRPVRHQPPRPPARRGPAASSARAAGEGSCQPVRRSRSRSLRSACRSAVCRSCSYSEDPTIVEQAPGLLQEVALGGGEPGVAAALGRADGGRPRLFLPLDGLDEAPGEGAGRIPLGGQRDRLGERVDEPRGRRLPHVGQPGGGEHGFGVALEAGVRLGNGLVPLDGVLPPPAPVDPHALGPWPADELAHQEGEAARPEHGEHEGRHQQAAHRPATSPCRRGSGVGRGGNGARRGRTPTIPGPWGGGNPRSRSEVRSHGVSSRSQEHGNPVGARPR